MLQVLNKVDKKAKATTRTSKEYGVLCSTLQAITLMVSPLAQCK